MTSVETFEFILALIAVSVGLKLAARPLRLPPAATLIVGGAALALVPGVPRIELDPELAMVLFLPPLLLSSAYLTRWRDFRADLRIILQLAVGAVLFTTLLVGVTAHALVPGLPWSACFALGAIVSPPDAVAAKAVLQGLPLPRRVIVLLEGESLINDATGLVVYRFAVTAALTGAFSSVAATSSFALLAGGGVAIGTAFGFLASSLIARLKDVELSITASLLAAWGAYIGGETLQVSGVLSTVACGIVMGWRQHANLSAEKRIQTRAVWGIVTFVLESLVFVFIGLSLNVVTTRLSDGALSLTALAPAVLAVVGTVVVSRFAWIFPAVYVVRALLPGYRRRDPYPPLAIPIIMSWAGMRGVVSLAAALALPLDFPGRDFILVAAFAVIVVTVLVQGSTLAPLIRVLKVGDRPSISTTNHLTEMQARLRVVSAEFEEIKRRSLLQDGTHRHPRLVEQHAFRIQAITQALEANGALSSVRIEHFSTVFAAVEAGRGELLRLHRDGEIDDDVLDRLEHELDVNEMRALQHHAPLLGRAKRPRLLRALPRRLPFSATELDR